MSQNLKSMSTLSKLEDFKYRLQNTFAKECEDKYGRHTYNFHMKPYIDDLLENFEGKLEQLTEREILEEELSYDQSYEGE